MALAVPPFSQDFKTSLAGMRLVQVPEIAFVRMM